VSTRVRALPHNIPVKVELDYWTEDVHDHHTTPEVHSESDYTAYLSSMFQGIQVTESENHPGWNASHRGRFSGDRGGPFSTRKRYVDSFPNVPVKLNGITWDGGQWYNRARYSGILLPIAPDYMEFPPFSPSSNSQLDAMGATAIARCSPSSPAADCSTFLGETVKDGLPRLGSLLGLRNMSNQERRKALADSYLNYEFSWLPFANDVAQLGASIVDADSIWEQYQRDSGKLVRRRYEFPTVETTTVEDYGVRSPWAPSPSSITLLDLSVPLTGRVYCEIKTTVRRWFSGAFSYYIPQGSDARSTVAREAIKAKKLLGLTMTPDTVWNLAPWSWAVDWFTNTGDVLSNWSNWLVDSQVLMYGYMMEHKRVSYTYSYSGPTRFQTTSVRPPNITLVSETKLRRAATPYGFGFDMGGLTTVQSAIVAALGISHTH